MAKVTYIDNAGYDSREVHETLLKDAAWYLAFYTEYYGDLARTYEAIERAHNSVLVFVVLDIIRKDGR